MTSIYEGGADGATPTTGGETLRGQVTEAREKLAEAGDTVRGEAAHFAEKAKDQVASQVEAKTETVSNALGVFADTIRNASEDLGGQDQTFAAKLAGHAADGLQSFSRTLAGKSPEELLHAARDLGRNNPTAFLAGAVLAGVAIGRFARSSAEHPHPVSAGDGQTAGPGDDAAIGSPEYALESARPDDFQRDA